MSIALLSLLLGLSDMLELLKVSAFCVASSSIFATPLAGCGTGGVVWFREIRMLGPRVRLELGGGRCGDLPVLVACAHREAQLSSCRFLAHSSAENVPSPGDVSGTSLDSGDGIWEKVCALFASLGVGEG